MNIPSSSSNDFTLFITLLCGIGSKEFAVARLGGKRPMYSTKREQIRLFFPTLFLSVRLCLVYPFFLSLVEMEEGTGRAGEKKKVRRVQCAAVLGQVFLYNSGFTFSMTAGPA